MLVQEKRQKSSLNVQLLILYTSNAGGLKLSEMRGRGLDMEQLYVLKREKGVRSRTRGLQMSH